MDKGKKRNLPTLAQALSDNKTFLRTLFPLIKIRLAFAFCCSYQYSEEEIISYFQNLIRERANEFLKGKGKKHPQQGRQIGYLLNKLPLLVKIYKIRMREKGLSFLHEQNKEEN
jgi:hypothetical protein